ncbi:MAG: ABC transporter permease [Blautia sp.]|nr:ABC transporter permease [Lachnoclostridium sp.]MCM1210307.1 ABC transporter permease [Blautia sp.]
MHPLTKLYLQKIGRQKLIYLFFACFFTASFFYAFLISTPQMEEMLNINIGIVGEKNFPEFMMRFYVGTVGILFQVFLLTLFICEEDKTKMLYQPLLHGATRSRILKSKIRVAISLSMIFVLTTAFLNYTTAFMRWGYAIFELSAVTRTIMKYLLSGVYMSVIMLGIIVLCVYTRSTWKTICFIIIYLLMDSFIYGSGILPLQKIWIGYYLNLWTFSYEFQTMQLSETLIGIFVMALYGAAFYQISFYKIEKIDF